MTRAVLLCASIVILVATAPAIAGDHTAKQTHVARNPSNSTEGDCEARIEKLDASNAEGEERLAEKNEVLDFCASQYEHDKTIERLVKECAKYEEQPVVKQQFLADCQLAAFNYANALRSLKAEYGK
jgi:hypothetical protein